MGQAARISMMLMGMLIMGYTESNCGQVMRGTPRVGVLSCCVPSPSGRHPQTLPPSQMAALMVQRSPDC